MHRQSQFRVNAIPGFTLKIQLLGVCFDISGFQGLDICRSIADITDLDNTTGSGVFHSCHLIYMSGIQHQCSATDDLMYFLSASLTFCESEKIFWG